MSKLVFECLRESDPRGRAMDEFWRTTQSLVNNRQQFTLTKETREDGSFTISIEGSGRPVEADEIAQVETEPVAEPRVRRAKKTEGEDVAQP